MDLHIGFGNEGGFVGLLDVVPGELLQAPRSAVSRGPPTGMRALLGTFAKSVALGSSTSWRGIQRRYSTSADAGDQPHHRPVEQDPQFELAGDRLVGVCRRFVRDECEAAYVHYTVATSWNLRIFYGFLCGGLAVVNFTVAPPASMRVMFYVVCLLWVLGACTLAAARRMSSSESGLSGDRRLDELNSFHQVSVVAGAETHGSLTTTQPPSLGAAAWSGDTQRRVSFAFPTRDRLLIASVVESISTTLYWSATVLLLISAFFGKSACRGVDAQLAYDQCYKVFGVEYTPMIAELLLVMLVEARTQHNVVGMVLLNGAFVLANFLVPFKVDPSTPRFATTYPVFFLQSVLCLSYSYTIESGKRKAFAVAVTMERTAVRLATLRRIAHDAASKRIPEHILKSFTDAKTSLECSDGVVCSFCITSFGPWCDGRCAADVVNTLASLFAEIDGSVKAIVEDIQQSFAGGLCVTRVNVLGEVMLLTFHRDASTAAARTAGEAMYTGPPADDDTPLPALLWPSLLEAVERLHARCIQIQRGGQVKHLKLMPFVEKSRRGVDIPAFGAALAVSHGPFRLHVVPTAAAVLASGAAVEECTRESLRMLTHASNSTWHGPPTWMSEAFACASAVRKGPRGMSSNRVTFGSGDAATTAKVLSAERRMASSAQRLNSSSGLVTLVQTPSDTAQLQDGKKKPALSAQQRGEAALFPSANTSASNQLSRSGGVESDPHPPKKSHATPATRWGSFDMAPFTGRFTDASLEHAYLSGVRRTCRNTVVTIGGAFMCLFCMMLLVACAVYDTWTWSWNSPIPYVCGSLCCGGATLCVARLLPKDVHFFVVELLYYGFGICFVMSSFATTADLGDSVIGLTIMPWVVVAVSVTVQRPLWLPPLWMWLLEAFLAAMAVVKILLRHSHAPETSNNIGEGTMAVSLLIGSSFVRIWFDRERRAGFIAERTLEDDASRLREASTKVLSLLSQMVPLEETKRILVVARASNAAAAHGVRHLGNHFVSNRWRGNMSAMGIQSCIMSSTVEERAFAILHVGVCGAEDTARSVLVHQTESRMGVSREELSTAEVDSTTAVLPGTFPALNPGAFSAQQYVSLVATIRAVLVDVNSAALRINPDGAEAVLAKFCGDLVVISAATNTDASSSASRRAPKDLSRSSGISVVIAAVSRLRLAFSSQYRVRAWIGWSPVVGALLGDVAPTFEWYSAAMHRGVSLLRRMPTDGSPIGWQEGYLSDDAYAGLCENRRQSVAGLSPSVMEPDVVSWCCGSRLVWCVRGVGKIGAYQLQL